MSKERCMECNIRFETGNSDYKVCPKCREGSFKEQRRHDIFDVPIHEDSLPFAANH